MRIEPWAAWADHATEATVALIPARCDDAATDLSVLGAVTRCEVMSFNEGLVLQGSFYDDGTDGERTVIQVERIPGVTHDWWVAVEPNGFRLSFASNLQAVAGELAAAFFWNVNAVMTVLKVDRGGVIEQFDPFLDVDQIPKDGRDLPFEEAAASSSITLLHRWTGVRVTGSLFSAPKETLIVEMPYERASALPELPPRER